MAPSLKKALDAFITDIPDDKLKNFPDGPGTIFNDDNFRLDMQGLTTGDHNWNLQIQANKKAPNTSVRKVAPATVSIVIYKRTSEATPTEVRDGFRKSSEKIPQEINTVNHYSCFVPVKVLLNT